MWNAIPGDREAKEQAARDAYARGMRSRGVDAVAANVAAQEFVQRASTDVGFWAWSIEDIKAEAAESGAEAAADMGGLNNAIPGSRAANRIQAAKGAAKYG
jgi:hypothetical protein